MKYQSVEIIHYDTAAELTFCGKESAKTVLQASYDQLTPEGKESRNKCIAQGYSMGLHMNKETVYFNIEELPDVLQEAITRLEADQCEYVSFEICASRNITNIFYGVFAVLASQNIGNLKANYFDWSAGYDLGSGIPFKPMTKEQRDGIKNALEEAKSAS